MHHSVKDYKVVTGLLFLLFLAVPLLSFPMIAHGTEADSRDRYSSDQIMKEIKSFLDQWAEDWVGMAYKSDWDFYKYERHYADDFYSKGMNKQQWMADKRRKYYQKGWVSVKFDDIRLDIRDRTNVTVTFHQIFKSSNYGDDGYKTLVLKKQGDRWLIRSETWVKK